MVVCTCPFLFEIVIKAGQCLVVGWCWDWVGLDGESMSAYAIFPLSPTVKSTHLVAFSLNHLLWGALRVPFMCLSIYIFN